MSFLVALMQQQRDRRSAATLDAALARVLERGYAEVGDPYRFGAKGPDAWDCSGFVAWCYEGRVRAFTDWIYEDTVACPDPRPGDVVLYEYADPGQPGVRFPHAGLWLSDAETLDARGGLGIGVHPHLVGAARVTRRVPGLDPGGAALFTPEQVAAVLGSPLENVRAQWPLVVAALEEFGIADEPVQVAAAATVGVETRAFLPVREAWWLSEAWRAANLRYYPYYGRGLIQLTWASNYARAERELGIGGLVADPDLALDERHSARILAWYFATHPAGEPLIPRAARRGDWAEVRRLVQGGAAGLADFLAFVAGLQAARHGG